MRRSLFLSMLAAAAFAGLSACGGGGDDGGGTPTPKESAATPSAAPLGVADLAKAVVQIRALDRSGDTVWHGSGTIISPEGLILTNAHVVDDRFDEYDELGVAMTTKTDEPPELKYVAEIAAVDYGLDLAVIRIVSDLDGNRVDEVFPSVPIGDSENVDIGDSIRILGYPGIGGETITFTNGVVSGFTAERSVGGRAWIKTDATIAGGNSGGLAVDPNGRLIGVPTIAGSGSESAAFVDCRLITDTNRDGVVDESDTCVPVGGFINGLRPVNLAQPLIAAVEAGRDYVSEIGADETPAPNFRADDVLISNMVFADGVTELDEPTNVVETLPAGAERACAFWDYEGMQDGVSWEAVWYVDGTLNEEGSVIDDTWVGGESGNWWVCLVDEQDGLADGLYEVIISVDGEARGSNVIFVGGDHPPVAFEIDNTSDTPICYVFLSPSGAQNWGFDKLGTDEGIDARDSKTLQIPAGTYDMLLQDCDQNDLLQELALDLTEDNVYTVTNQ
ncbi:MAG: serine protease [Dehalococcoidia bacterium]|nr:serine protease [Dehalococcoidia bacterium]